jgi:hypothetical protein
MEKAIQNGFPYLAIAIDACSNDDMRAIVMGRFQKNLEVSGSDDSNV